MKRWMVAAILVTTSASVGYLWGRGGDRSSSASDVGGRAMEFEYYGYHEDGALITRGYIGLEFPEGDDGEVTGHWFIVPVSGTTPDLEVIATTGVHIGTGSLNGTLYPEGPRLALKLAPSYDVEDWLRLEMRDDGWQGAWAHISHGRRVREGDAKLKARVWRNPGEPRRDPWRRVPETIEGTEHETRYELMMLCRGIRAWYRHHDAPPEQLIDLFPTIYADTDFVGPTITAFGWRGEKIVDPWGTEYRMEVDEDEGVVTIISAGGDREFGTDDDLVSTCHLAREEEPTDGGR